MSLTFSRGHMPYPTPPAGAPLRLAFVGQATFFEACALMRGTAGLETRFVEFRQESDPVPMLASLRAWAPHVVLVFRPEIVPNCRRRPWAFSQSRCRARRAHRIPIWTCG
jgi:hypothetical protein